jgi:hypothetical protein
MVQEPEPVVDFPTLGFLAADWIAAHCTVPSGHDLGSPLEHNGWQLWCSVNHYRVRPDIEFCAERPLLATAFFYRRSVIVGPQKNGKSPWGASIVIFEAVGPCIFAGWAAGGEVYRCEDHGCGCGFEYWYEPGEPMGMPRNKSLIQLLATAETQTANVYEPIQTMITSGPLAEVMKVREGFIRLPNRGKIEPVSAAARSKLGNPINAALADESGLYTASNKLLAVWQTMRRGLAGMGGRALEITNPWDPMENSAAQQAFVSRQKDIFRHYRKPPANLSYANKAHRHRIHVHVYRDAPWVDVDGIDAEAAELVETDPEQAERFFGNRMVQGLGSWIKDGLWEQTQATIVVPDFTEVCGGFDGSESDDWTAIRLRTYDGHRFTPTYGPDNRPTIWIPAEWGGSIPRGEVHAAVDELNRRYRLRLFLCDPRDWQSEIGEWALKYGEEVFVEWATYRVVHMHDALNRSLTDLSTGRSTHDTCPLTAFAAANARKVAKPGDRYILGKPSPHQKIDPIMADTLANEAGAIAIEGGWNPNEAGLIYTASSTRARG